MSNEANKANETNVNTFIKWMKEKHAWTEFKQEFKVQNGDDAEVMEFLNKVHQSCFLDSGFQWSKTENIEDWIKLDFEWIEHPINQEEL